ncbi:MAG: hypothetical protein JSS60_06165 [Verrucomicrobia bacterium]|nr:hypothetical protein [Verrucomicrobiota bacterium]
MKNVNGPSLFVICTLSLLSWIPSGFAAQKSAASSNANGGTAPRPKADTTRCIIDVDYIYWLAKDNGNEYAAKGCAFVEPGSTPTATPVKDGRVYAPEHHMQSGFKVGLDTFCGEDRWDVAIEYTYFHGDASGSAHSGNTNSGLVATYNYAPQFSSLASATFNGGSDSYLGKATSDWDLYLNVIDVDLGRRLMVSPKVWIRPFFGLKGTWQHQRLDVDYITYSVNDGSFYGKTNVTDRQKFWGLGLRMGANSNWQFAKHWSLFANGAIDLLWGRTQADGEAHDTNGPLLLHDVKISDQDYSYHSITPVIEFFAGLSFDWAFNCSLKKLSIKAGWEEQVWFFQNRHTSMISDISLIMQGLTTRAEFSF